MNSKLRWANPLKKAATAFFTHDLALQRGEGGTRLVLRERKPGPVAERLPTAQELAMRRLDEELQRMRRELTDLLNEDLTLRNELRHLAFVEGALGTAGLDALYQVPVDVLKTALDQFEGLVTNWSPEGLACLRSKMAVAVRERENAGLGADASEQASSLAARVIESAQHGAEMSRP